MVFIPYIAYRCQLINKMLNDLDFLGTGSIIIDGIDGVKTEEMQDVLIIIQESVIHLPII